MKVLLIHSFHYERGGDSTYARALGQALLDGGHQVIPLAMRHPLNDPSPWEQRFVSWVDPRSEEPRDRLRAGLRLVWSWEAARATQRLIAEVHPDVAHLQHVHRHLTPSVLGPLRQARVPVVWTLHDYELVCPNGLLYTNGRPCERCGGGRFHQAIVHRCKQDQIAPSVAAALEKSLHALLRVTDRVDRFLCPSRWLAEAVVRMGLPRDRVFHLPNLTPRLPESVPPTAGNGWLVASRLTREKGVHIAIEAAQGLPDHILHICGSGPEEPRLRHQAADLPNVRFHGHLPQAALAALTARARVVAVPSLWPENLPYAVFEAQAQGRPVVASAVGGIPEQVEDGVDGVLVPPGESLALRTAIAGLMAEPARASAMGVAARTRLSQRAGSVEHVAALLEHYKAAANRATRTPTRV
jgi:glycosyltransferase involved in cell wall biosynthesis